MAVLVKAYIRQLFGSPEIQVFEFDSKDGTVEDLKKSVSDIIGGRAVQLAWIDQAGDRIQLSNDDQLKLAVSYGVKDNVLRISAQVDWLGVTSSARRGPATTATTEEGQTTDEETATQAETAADAEGEEANATGDGEPGAEKTEEATAATAAAAATAGAENRTSKRKCRRRQCPGSTHYSGYVRTVGADGVAKERSLTDEEAAYLLSRSTSGRALDSWSSPLCWSGSVFSHPALEYRRPTTTPLFLAW